MASNTKKVALDMGALQSNLESASKALKAAQTAQAKANEVAARAEAEYESAKKSLAAGMAQLMAATKVA